MAIDRSRAFAAQNVIDLRLVELHALYGARAFSHAVLDVGTELTSKRLRELKQLRIAVLQRGVKYAADARNDECLAVRRNAGNGLAACDGKYLREQILVDHRSRLAAAERFARRENRVVSFGDRCEVAGGAGFFRDLRRFCFKQPEPLILGPRSERLR